MAVLGLLIAMVGIDPVRGAPRFTFGIPSLYDGVGFIPVVMGLFGVAEILLTVEQPLPPGHQDQARLAAALARGVAPLARRHRTRHRHRLFPGLDPGRRRHHSDLRGLRLREAHLEDAGAGSGTAPSRAWRRPRRANNAYANAAMIPLLTLGIPSSPTIAVLMGAFIINGLTPGPFLFQERPDLVWAVIASFFLGNILLLILNLPLRRLVGALAASALSVRVRRHAAVLRHRRLQPAAERVRCRRHDRVRHHRLWHAQDRSADRTAGARADPRTVPREVAANLARDVGAAISRSSSRARSASGCWSLAAIVLARLGAAAAAAPRCARHPTTESSESSNQKEERQMSTLHDTPSRCGHWRSPRRPAARGAAGFSHQADPADGRLPGRRIDRHRGAHRRMPSPRRRWASRSSSSTRAAPAARSAGPSWCARSPTATTSASSTCPPPTR